MSSFNIKKLVGDNRTVLTNYAKNKYGFRDLFIKGPVFESSFQMDTVEAFTSMVEDYNNKTELEFITNFRREGQNRSSHFVF